MNWRENITKRLIGALVASLGMFAFLVMLAAPAQAAYDSNNIIDDGRFTNHTTMDEAAIQAFMNARNSGLKNYVDPSVNQSAAKIIRDAAWDFGINPQVIMATLQKEQSLMTNPTPSASNINFAMGYGCPTTGSCSFPGFYTQVRNGSWQLRFNMHRAGGNSGTWAGPTGQTWGNSSIAYACRNATSYYSTGLFPGRTVTFYAHTNGQAYANVAIANAATAAMYCYTPHVYNPSGVPVYYSGSYNFVTFYERWFGPTQADSWSSSFVSQSAFPVVQQGQSATASFALKNTGNQPWYDNTGSASTPGTRPVHLATSNPVNRTSIFNASWPAPNRAAINFSAVYEADGVTPAANQRVAQPGQIAQFTITYTAPIDGLPGSYREYFILVNEGNTFFNNIGIFHDVTITETPATSPRVVYRHYSPTRRAHFFTIDANESRAIRSQGWNYEGVGFKATITANGKPVYRHYSPSRGAHFFTTSLSESQAIRSQGWNYEGVAFYTNESTGGPVYRHYNPSVGRHFFTTSLGESQSIRSQGWNYEGIAFYSF